MENQLEINKSSNNLEKVLLSDLDIVHSPITATDLDIVHSPITTTEISKQSKNFFEILYDFFIKRLSWFMCIKI